MRAAPHRLSGAFSIGGQDHFYLEGQIALAAPGEDRTMRVYSSTQHPSEVQKLVAHCLGLTIKDCRRGPAGAWAGDSAARRRSPRSSPASRHSRHGRRAGP
jgi:xanthine dehydrogenase molybdopterin-binding subunit B